jgi:hypothetical protein
VTHWVIVRSPCAQKIFQSFVTTPFIAGHGLCCRDSAATIRRSELAADVTSSFADFTSRTAVGLLTLAIGTLVTRVAAAAAEPGFWFEKAACPEMPTAIPELKTARCGQLTLLENRRQPNGRAIILSVATIPAASANPKPDPIVWLAGGPGDDAITEIPMALAGDAETGDRVAEA